MNLGWNQQQLPATDYVSENVVLIEP